MNGSSGDRPAVSTYPASVPAGVLGGKIPETTRGTITYPPFANAP
jgi:hypothetical protein